MFGMIDKTIKRGILFVSPMFEKYGIKVKIANRSVLAAVETNKIIKQYNMDSNELILFLADLSERLGRAISGNKFDDPLTLVNRRKEHGLKKGEQLIVMAEDLRMLVESYLVGVK